MDDRRVAIITGGTRGIGVGISKAMAAEKRKLALVYRSHKEQAEKVAKELSALTEVELIQADLGIKAEAEKVANTVLSRWGRIDILVNNAGIFDFKFLDEMDEAFLDKIMRTNFYSSVFMVQAVLPAMKKAKFGRIANASSISGRFADVGLVAYAASKSGMDMMARIGAGELGPYNITINNYAPGIVETDMTAAMIKERGHEQIKQMPVGRFGEPEDVAALVSFLCSDAAGYVTGEIIGVDGGMLKVQNPQRAFNRQ